MQILIWVVTITATMIFELWHGRKMYALGLRHGSRRADRDLQTAARMIVNSENRLDRLHDRVEALTDNAELGWRAADKLDRSVN